jgi:hypothetical protein
VSGKVDIFPEDNALAALAEDYANMLADQIMLGDCLNFEQLMKARREIEIRANRAALL